MSTVSLPVGSAVGVAAFVKRQKELLQLERDEERKMLGDKLSSLSSKACESEGLSVLHMEIESIRSGLYGRTVAALQRLDKKPLPAHSFKVGDEVRVFAPKLQYTPAAESSSVSGVITKISPLHMEFVTDGDVDEPSFPAPLRVDMLANEGTHKKMMCALADLEGMDSKVWPLADILFGQGPTGLVQDVKITPFNAGLNASQIEAIENALGSPYLAAIHGPPGTGKTTAVMELILQAVARGQRVLVCAPSNVAVDNILEKLVAPPTGASSSSSSSSSSSASSSAAMPPRPQVVRLGHPARVSPSIQQHCLEALITSDEGTEIVNDVRRELDQLRRAMGKSRDRSHRRELSGEMRALRKEARKREEAVVSSILRSRDVVLATCVGAANKLLKQLDIPFDFVVIDEAAQALEASCWVPMLRSRKCVLAGDHCQLPPTVKSKEAVSRGLAVTLFERVVTDTARLGQVGRMLNVQYRMNSLICSWASDSMYHSQLRSHQAVAAHTIAGLPLMQRATDIPVALLIDTAGCLMEEDDQAEAVGGRSVSHRNPREAEVVAAHVRQLLSAGLRSDQVGVITPYNGQLEVLRELLHPPFPGLEIRTVDGFQGGEKEAIVISFVRSNARREVGFLSDRRRINVAVTRARRHLCIVCDSETCSSDAFIKGLIGHVSDKGEHRSALDFMLDGEGDGDGDGECEGGAEQEAAEVQTALEAGAAQAGGGTDPSLASASSASSAAPSTASKVRKSRAEQKRQKQADASSAAKAKPPARDTAERLAFDNALHAMVLSFARGGLPGGRVELRPPASLEIISARHSKSSKLSSGLRHLRFPPSLNSFQRQSVHALCDELGLAHASFGEGAERYIQISVEARAERRRDAGDAREEEEEEVEVEVEVGKVGEEAGGEAGGEAASQREQAGAKKGEEGEDDHDDHDDDDEEEEEEQGKQERQGVPKPPSAKNKKKKAKKPANKGPPPPPALPSGPLPQTHPSLRARPAPAPASALLQGALADGLDDDAILEAAIQDNEAAREASRRQAQFRMPCKPMPNPEQERAKKALHDKIAAAKADRRPEAEAAREDKEGKEGKGKEEGRPKPRPKAVLNKPFLRLDGRRLGTPDDKEGEGEGK